MLLRPRQQKRPVATADIHFEKGDPAKDGLEIEPLEVVGGNQFDHSIRQFTGRTMTGKEKS